MRLVILGSGGYGRTLFDIAEQIGYNQIVVLDDKDSEYPLSSFEQYINDNTEFIVAFGNNEFRLSWCKKITSVGGTLATLIHPAAYVSPKTTIGSGTVILPRAIVNTGTVIHQGCIINLGAIIDHDCVIEEGVHICLGAIVKGENQIEKCSKIEAGEIIERSTRK